MVIGALYPTKRLNDDDIALGNRQHALKQIIEDIKNCENYISTNFVAYMSDEGCREKVNVLRMPLVQDSEYDLVLYFKGCISFENHPTIFIRPIFNEWLFLGRILVIDIEDAEEGCYLLGFEKGQTFYVSSEVYDALVKGEQVVCRIDKNRKCWVPVSFQPLSKLLSWEGILK